MWSATKRSGLTGVLLATLTSGCHMEVDSPAKAFGVGSQKDRTATVYKNIFGAGASIPLTDLKGDGWLVTYDKGAGSFTLKMDHFDQNWSSTMLVENARIKENQNLYLDLIARQQEIADRQIDAWKEFGNHALDTAASAIGAVAKMPGGENIASGMIGKLLASVVPQMVPQVIAALTKHGVTVAPAVVPAAP